MESMISVADFYAGKTIFVTGATGFMGKVLVEKLLRSCPDVKEICILLRQKKGQSAKDRLVDFTNCQVFDKIRDERPENLNKIVLIGGDILKTDLSMSEDDRKKLINSCQIIFHCAACVRFDQKLKEAVAMNTSGTKRIMDLASEMKKLEVFLHVSTTFNNCELDILQEQVYKSPHDPHQIMEITEWMDQDVLDVITPKIIEPQPNTYAYTKGLTEDLVSKYEGKFPIVIARPSIVVAALKEPMPGWVENLNGPTGLLIGAGKGVIRTMLCKANYRADVVQVDIAINACIILAYRAAIQKSQKIEVCNLAESGINPLTWGDAIELGRKHVTDYPFSVCLWYPGGSIKSSRFIHTIAAFLFHILPAYFIDFLMILMRKKTFMVRVQKKVSDGLTLLQYYTTKQWQFANDNFASLSKYVNDKDREIFYTDMSKIDWNEYLKVYILGAREYCCKEDPATLPSARKLLKRLYFVDKATQITVYALISWLLYSHIHFLSWAMSALSSAVNRISPIARVMAEET